MFRGREAERLRLGLFLGMQTSVNLAVPDDDDGQHHAEEHCTNSDHPRKADCLEHHIAQSGNFVPLDDFHYDGRAWCLHGSIVLQG